MRGKVCTAEHDERQPGIIPAYAGKRRSDWIIRSIYWDHPRMCGEKVDGGRNRSRQMGSPPRMRGKICADVIVHIQPGITPACAGKSRSQPRLPCTGRDHPRVCREKFTFFSRGISQSGSPPHVRGKVKPVLWAARVAGITPAYAGKRCRSPAFRSMPWDHPRVCGEKSDRPNIPESVRGSPPRMRGKGFCTAIVRSMTGITPAHAGKSACCIDGLLLRRDHPRACGEKVISTLSRIPK